MLHEESFIKSYDELKNFFNRKKYLYDLQFKNELLIRGLHSFLNLLLRHLHYTDKRKYDELVNNYGFIIDKILKSKNLNEAHNNIIDSNFVGSGIMKGGSFFDSIGHFFSNVGNTIKNTAVKAYNTVKSGVEKGIDYEKSHIRGQLSTALPYVEKYVINPAVSMIPGAGPVLSKGLNVAEQKLNPLIKSKIAGN